MEVIDLGWGDALCFGVLDDPLLLGDGAIYGGQRGVVILAMLEFSNVASSDVCSVVVWRNVHSILLLQCAISLQATGELF